MVKIAWADCYAHPLPEGHRFPMEKYTLLPQQLLYEGTIEQNQIFAPSRLPVEDLLRVHDSEYWIKLKNQLLTPAEQRKTGFPLSPELVEREITIAQGTVDCCYAAVQYGAALNVAGGTHHAFRNRGEGFCLLNDIAIAAAHLRANGLAQQILVIDLDVHQGNGTAAIFQDVPEVFTFSMHGQDNYPLRKEQSDLDIGLTTGTTDDEYLTLLAATLPRLFDEVEPDFVFFQSGVDVLATDKLGHLNMSIQGCKERDRMVWTACYERGIPVVASMGGGYSVRIADIIEAHANTFRLAVQIFQ